MKSIKQVPEMTKTEGRNLKPVPVIRAVITVW
jgi:hypothetical protein